MRFIPISPVKVEKLKKKAKELQRNGGGKHRDLLDRLARGEGYEHWHHVTLCLKESMQATNDRSIEQEIKAIVEAELAGRLKMVVTGPETTTSQPFLLFSTGIGDAWMLDSIRRQALCLVWRGETQPITVRDLPHRIEMLWDGTFELRGEFFFVTTEHAEIRTRGIAGYPMEELRSNLDIANPVEHRMTEILEQEGVVELTPEVVAQLVRTGWNESELLKAARQGARYSPSRNTILFAAVGS